MRTALVCVRTPLAAQSIATCASRLGVTTIRTAVSETEVLARLADGPAELILADTAITRPDTVGFTKRVLARAPQAVLVLLGAEEPQVAAAAVAAGARGLIRGGDHDLVGTVTKVLLLIGGHRRAGPAGDPVPASQPPAGGGPPAGVANNGGSPAGDGVPAGGSSAPAGPIVAAGGTVAAGGPARPVDSPTGPAAGRRAGERGPAREVAAKPGGNASAVVVPAQRADPAVGAAARRANLTERELQVLRGMAEGKSNAEIGRDLYVSEDTVKTHARRLFRKLRARDRAHAVAVGFRAGALS